MYRAAISLIFLLLASVAHAASSQQIILYKDGAHPAADQSQPQWLAPDSAYSAITYYPMWDRLKAAGAHALVARAQIVMQTSQPGTLGAAIFACPSQHDAGGELVGCATIAWFVAIDDAPAPYTPGCGLNPGGPYPCVADVTDPINNLIAAGNPDSYIVAVAYGNGQHGPVLYDAELQIVWQ